MAATVFAAVANSIQIVSRLREINKNVENSEFSNALADLGLELAQLKSALATVLDENTRLKAQLAAVEAPKPDLQFKAGAYFKDGSDGPYCSGCYDTSGKLVRLSPVPAKLSHIASHLCPVCKAPYAGTGA
ncbi:hypothetical protein [Luteimonas sp. MC1572]|uniref:hypothetical protein n=1 Tax=Luteimonas sp. MC1572 TaxID=2799325 RepID=UPI0018F0AF25|nr:hypothetical protein [Luteimonas sp. MC1572]MBJ6981951.1 hypothetical protein [Luteimonas sp. MC1572]QQO03226.1 hypothetical protein JGR64_00120 [Luteimonas sp. MC1572]